MKIKYALTTVTTKLFGYPWKNTKTIKKRKQFPTALKGFRMEKKYFIIII